MKTSYRRRFGDRKDGRLLRSLPAFSKFIPFIMPTRNDASNLYEESMEVSVVDRRLRKLRVDGYKGIGMLHFLIAAYIRLISMLPGLNRFVVGRRIYARNDITVSYDLYHIQPYACGIPSVVLPIFWLSKHVELTPYAKRLFGPDSYIKE